MRVGLRLPGLLAVGVSSVVALSGVFGAGAAVAAEPGEQCSGANIEGQGSSLQKTAMETWTATFNTSANGAACNGTQGSGGKPTVTYTSSGSGAGKTAWGAEKAGNKPSDGKKENPAESGDAFIGTDEPLTPAQMKNVDEAAGAASGQAVVVPVEQAAVAVIVNPPAECLITKITNADLQKIWNTEITEWSSVTGGSTEGAGVTEDEAGACKHPITRVVRKDSSGTTFVFKSYLAEILKTATCSGTTWEAYAAPAENLNWPDEPSGTCKGKVVHAANSGGGGEAEEVQKTSGAIGYANLADALPKFTNEVGNHFHWVGVQNQKVAKNFFPYPGTETVNEEPVAEAGESNCKGTTYTNKPTTIGADDDWSKVSGAHTKTNENYPICTLTYDVVLMNYKTAGLSETAAATAYDFINYVVAPGGGQKEIAKKDYREVEEAVGTYAREEALIVAEGTDVKPEVTGVAFDSEENIFLFELPKLFENFTVTFKNGGDLTTTPTVEILLISGAVNDTNNCNGVEIKSGGTCTVEVEGLENFLIYIDWNHRRIFHIGFGS